MRHTSSNAFILEAMWYIPPMAIIFWLLFLGAAGMVWLVLAGLAIWGWRRKVAWLAWMAGAPAALMLVAGFVLGALIVAAGTKTESPQEVFEDTFRTPPPPGIENLQGETFWSFDSWEVFLKFRAKTDEFHRLLPLGLKAMTTGEAQVDYMHGSKPDWWDFRFDDTWFYYGRDEDGGTGSSDKNRESEFAYEREMMAYDPTTGNCYYFFMGID